MVCDHSSLYDLLLTSFPDPGFIVTMMANRLDLVYRSFPYSILLTDSMPPYCAHQGHHGWIHWFTYPVPDGGSPNIDYWPDTSQYTQEELFVAPGFKHKDGQPAHLFSSRNPKTVQRSGTHYTLIARAGLIASCRHFHWMAQNGVDGVFLQRFVGLCDIASGGNDGNRRIRDEVGEHVKNAAEREGRVYAIM